MQSDFGFGDVARARPPLRIIDDLGPVGEGASAARYVRCENGSEYLIKGPTLSPDNPMVAANEQVCVELARFVDLPVLQHDVADWQGSPVFASQYMTRETFHPHLTAELLSACLNRERIYGVVTFDAWVCNVDRHQGNLLARRTKEAGGGEVLLLNDHSHTLARPGVPIGELMQLANTGVGPYCIVDFIRAAITDERLLGEALGRIEAVSDGIVAAVLQQVPDAWLEAPAARDAYLELLADRRAHLREWFAAERAIFPNLGIGGQAA